jgi:hypothetical protein
VNDTGRLMKKVNQKVGGKRQRCVVGISMRRLRAAQGTSLMEGFPAFPVGDGISHKLPNQGLFACSVANSNALDPAVQSHELLVTVI